MKHENPSIILDEGIVVSRILESSKRLTANMFYYSLITRDKIELNELSNSKMYMNVGIKKKFPLRKFWN